MPAQTVIKFRRDTAANWTSTNPVLASGEAGLETDTGLVKYGNGTSTWTALSYPSNSNTTYLVRNNTGTTIAKGTLVAATGAEPSGRIDVAPFEVTGLQDSELRVMGIATANIASGVNGTVMSFGTLTGLDTRGTVESALAVGDEDWDAGDILYAHPTVDGKLTKLRPKHDLAVAFITVSHASSGQIAIRIVPGNFHLEWLHDVALDAPTEGQVLQYDGTDWVNADIDALPSQTGNSGKYLTTDGAAASWGVLDIPPGTTVSDTAPASPDEGQMWWNSTSGVLYIYYDAFWVEAVTGVVGPQGAAATIVAGTTTTGAAGTSASVVNSGTSSAAVLDFTIPQGAQGIQGETGATGPAGADGADGGFDSTQTIESGTTRALTSADAGKLLTNAGAITITVQGLSVGQQVDFLQTNAAQITFAAGAGMTLNSKDGNLKTSAQYSPASVKCIAANTYVLVGDLGA
jgi:hypothetical protein